MENQKMPEYETIRAAVAEGKNGGGEVVECYQRDEIDGLSTVAVRRPDGSTKQEINEDMRQSITKKLIEALPQFPLEEMEKGNVKIGKKRTGRGSQYMTSAPCLLIVLFS